MIRKKTLAIKAAYRILNHLRFYLINLLIGCLTIFSAVSQNNPGCSTESKKARKLFDEAYETLKTGQNEAAFDLLRKVIAEEPEHAGANFELGYYYYNLATRESRDPGKIKNSKQNFNKAEDCFLLVIQQCPSYENFSACFYLGQMAYDKGDYFTARPHLENFLLEKKIRQNDKKKAQAMLDRVKIYYDLIENPVDFQPIVVKGISTEKDEYLPLITPDGLYAFYTQRYFEKPEFATLEKYVENFTVSERVGQYTSDTVQFGSGQHLKYPFNHGDNQGGASISIDNNHLYITICIDVKDPRDVMYSNCDIYVSDFVNGSWSDFSNLGSNINGAHSWESQPSIASDGKTLFFASIRATNIGYDNNNQTSDLYYSVKDDVGHWSPAKNMGELINTPRNEKSPYMHSDSKTLYFSSDGHPGVGGYDIFYARQKKDNQWKKPLNIGYPINNEYDNLALVVSTNGRKAYFTSNEYEGVGGYDIYSFELYKEARPDEVLFVKGQLKDEKGNALTNASLEMRSSLTGDVTEGLVDQKTGKFAVAVSVEQDEDFLMTVKKDNCAFSSAYINPDSTICALPFKIDMEVKELKIGQTVEIKDIQFPSNSCYFNNESMFVLDRFAEFLHENPKVKIEIHGHTDNLGDTKANLLLSEKRAQSVRNYLWLLGVNSERIIACKGFGDSKPVAGNATEEGRARNRRTEFVILEK